MEQKKFKYFAFISYNSKASLLRENRTVVILIPNQTSTNTEVIVNDHPILSNADGYVSLSIPLTEQNVRYLVSSPSLIFVDNVMVMPCGSDDIMMFL